MDLQMAPEFDPQNEVQKWHPKRRPNTLNKALISFRFLLNQNIGHPFWVPFFDPILGGSNSGAIFGSIFQPHFGVQNMVQNLQKNFAAKAAWQTFFQQTCITKCICSHCPASYISEHNPLPGQAFQENKSFDCHKCCT